MVKIYKKYIWWNLINENKPTTKLLNVIENEMEENNDLKVNFVNYNNVEIVSKDLDITFILIIHKNKKYYYIVEGIKKILNNGYLLDLKLDIWCTFGLKVYDYLLENNNKVLCERTHKFDSKSIQYNDTLINNIPIQYNDVKIEKYMYPTKVINNINCYYNSNVAIESKALNSCFYYIFKDGDNGNYTFFPILTYKNEKIKIFKNNGKISESYVFINTYFDKGFNDKKEIFKVYKNDNGKLTELNLSKQEFDNKIINSNGDKKWYYCNVINDSIDLQKNTYYSSGDLLPSNFYSKLKYSVISNDRFTKYSYDKTMTFNQNVLINQSLSSYSKPSVNENCTYVKIDIYYGSGGLYEETLTDNSKIELENIKKSQQLSNKFLGIYFLPNILENGNLWNIKNLNGKTFLTINYSYELVNTIIKLPAINFTSEIKFNNNIISNINIMKLVKYKFFNNDINLGYLYAAQTQTDNNNIIISGKMNFTNKASLYCNFYMLSIKDSIIEYPDILPSSYDEYLNYVNATRNTANTSYNIAKQNAIKSGVLGGLSSLFGGINDMSNLMLNLDNEKFKPYNSITNYQNNFFSGVNAITSSILSVKQLESKMRANYKDKENTLGNNIVSSMNEDSMWIPYYAEQGQFNVAELIDLTENSIILLNNVIFLYGEFYPRYENFKDIIENEFMKKFHFTYIKLDKYYLSLIINNYVVERNYIKEVLEIYDNGIRLIDNVNYFDLVGEENA